MIENDIMYVFMSAQVKKLEIADRFIFLLCFDYKSVHKQLQFFYMHFIHLD